jgi:hypothetical protein
LQNGHAEAIEAFGKVLRLVPKTQRAAVRLGAEPELSEAIKTLPADVLQAFQKLKFPRSEPKTALLLRLLGDWYRPGPV